MHTLQVADPLGYSGYTPNQIRQLMELPPSGGAGTTIAIIDVGDTPSVNSDLTMFSMHLICRLPTVHILKSKKCQMLAPQPAVG